MSNQESNRSVPILLAAILVVLIAQLVITLRQSTTGVTAPPPSNQAPGGSDAPGRRPLEYGNTYDDKDQIIRSFPSVRSIFPDDKDPTVIDRASGTISGKTVNLGTVTYELDEAAKADAAKQLGDLWRGFFTRSINADSLQSDLNDPVKRRNHPMGLRLFSVDWSNVGGASPEPDERP